MKDIMKLQNGSDIRGIALEGIEGEEVNFDDFDAMRIGEAFVFWLSVKTGKAIFDMNICVGQDPRISGDMLKEGLMKGICAMGARVSDAGLASTPAMFMSTIMPYYEFDGAVMITASHLPWNRNGLKFFTERGGLDKEDITYILNKAAKLHPVAEYYECSKVNLMDMYAAHLRMLITSRLKGDLSGMKIVVDAGNGSGGFFATDVLGKLGADISGSQFLEPDGTFPNHQPNPENKEAMRAISERVVETGADLGIIFDTDVDRSAAVASNGKIIGRNEIIALAAAIAAGDHPGGTVVTDSITSNELHEFLEDKLGLKHFRFKRGYRNVINKAMELSAEGEDAFLAIETSGHAAFSDNYYLDDGAYLAVLIVIEAARHKREGKQIGDLISALKAPAEAKEYRLDIKGEDFAETGTAVLDGMLEWAAKMNGRKVRYGSDNARYRVTLTPEEPNYEGVRLNYRLLKLDGTSESWYKHTVAHESEYRGRGEGESYSGWFLLRKSLHDPVMPLNIESTDLNGIAMVVPLIRNYLDGFDKLSKL